jgi:hypothetical protein
MELFGVCPCPWVTLIPLKTVHSVHYEHCFHGICSKSAVKRNPFREGETSSCWVSQLLKELEHDVLVTNAQELKAIYRNPHKDDRADEETLARLGRLDLNLLSSIYHRSPQA